MSFLSSLVTYVERQGSAKLDWPAFLHALAEAYHAKAALWLHQFGKQQAGSLLESACIDPVWVNKYNEHAQNNPWLRFVWSKPVGTLIEGPQADPNTTARDFYENFMAPQNLHCDLGAILCKDRDTLPSWCVAITLFRPDGDNAIGRFADEEVKTFRGLIPFMARHIRSHPRLLSGRLRRRPAPNPADDEAANAASLARFVAELGIANATHVALLARVLQLAREHDAPRLAAVEAALADAPALSVLLPQTAPLDPNTGKPQYYADRPRSAATNQREDIAQFLERVWYDPWIKAGVLTRVALTRLDGQAARALQRYLRNRPLPAHLHSLLRPNASQQPRAVRVPSSPNRAATGRKLPDTPT